MNHLDFSNLQRTVLEAVVIVCLAAAIGLAFNIRVVMNAFSGKTIIGQPVSVAQSTFPVTIGLEKLLSLRERVVLIDARISELFAEGHLPGAVSLPYDEIDTRLPAFRDEVPVSRSLVIYCSGYGCPDSFDLGVRLIEAGYRDVMVYEGGFPEWEAAGRPIVKGVSP